MEQFIPHLEAAGATVKVSPFFDDAYLKHLFASGRRTRSSVAKAYLRRTAAIRRMRSADAIWVEKELYPFLPGVAERLLLAMRVPYAVDFDDAIFHNYDMSRNRLARRLLRNKLDPLLRSSRFVTAGNDYIADYARSHGAKDVLLVPTVVDPRRYNQGSGQQSEELRIGWIGTPPNVRFLSPILTAMKEVHARQRLRLVTIGAPPLPDLPFPQDCHSWSEATEGELLGEIDVGIMPLADGPWERGKCGYKLIQYMAAGKPVIASPIGVNSKIVSADVGFLAAHHEQWVSAIEWLWSNKEARLAMGDAARRKVVEDYSTDAVAPTIVRMFSALLGRSDR
jgi:glycosyltransferase involved in cell wall biosynthesis